MGQTGKRSMYLWRKEHQGTQRPKYCISITPVDTEILKNNDKSNIGEDDNKLGAEIFEPEE